MAACGRRLGRCSRCCSRSVSCCSKVMRGSSAGASQVSWASRLVMTWRRRRTAHALQQQWEHAEQAAASTSACLHPLPRVTCRLPCPHLCVSQPQQHAAQLAARGRRPAEAGMGPRRQQQGSGSCGSGHRPSGARAVPAARQCGCSADRWVQQVALLPARHQRRRGSQGSAAGERAWAGGAGGAAEAAAGTLCRVAAGLTISTTDCADTACQRPLTSLHFAAHCIKWIHFIATTSAEY